MKIEVPEGRYILAVSGGVDSMVLLDVLSKLPDIKIIVAHFNHGIREDSGEDEKLVSEAAGQYNIPLEVGYGNLGANASEDLARQKRYDFLYGLMSKYKADKIITAHHQDDLIETAFLNILRGTGSKGIVAISSNPKIMRPLLGTSKRELQNYAKNHNLKWREDATNKDPRYLRNSLRSYIGGLTSKDREDLIKKLDKIAKIHDKKQVLLATISQNIINKESIDRSRLNLLPVEVANELILNWLRDEKVENIDRRTVERLNIALRTASAGTIHDVKGGFRLEIGAKTAQLTKTS